MKSLLKGKGKLKLKLPEKKPPLPPRRGSVDALSEEPPGEELETFDPCGGVPSETSEEECPTASATDDPRRRTRQQVSEEDATELELVLSEEVVNLEALQRIVSCGHLNGQFRAIAWKLLLGYLPAERAAWEGVLAASRLRYTELKEELLLNPSEFSRKEDDTLSSTKQAAKDVLNGPLCRSAISNGDHPLSVGNGSIWNQYFKDSDIAEQIDRDLQRTHPDLKFFSGDTSLGKNNRESMRNILLLFAKLNPAIGYVQGMNEVLAPLFYVFSTDPDKQNASNAEADCFACFVLLMSDSVDHFCQQLDNSPVGIHSTLSHLSELLKANDKDLWQHLEFSSKVKPQLYAFRWITLMLTQEFKFYSIMRIWDSLLGNPWGVQEMLLRVCCAMLLCVRCELLDGDFASNLKLLQHYPQNSIEHVVDVARQLSPSSGPHLPPAKPT